MESGASADLPPARAAASLRTVASEWARIGVTGFGGPPAHIALLRRLVVDDRQWLSTEELEGAIAACNLLPGPASTQLAIYLARRVAGPAGAVVGGLCFIVPAVVAVVALSALFLATAPPQWIRGAGAGAGAAVAAVAVQAGLGLMGPSLGRARESRARLARWAVYTVLGAAAAALVGPYLVIVLLACGVAELAVRSDFMRARAVGAASWPLLGATAVGGLGPLAWVAVKVGALSFGGGFVIIPLMQGDAVHTYHWMTSTQFLNAVALGQVTPGPVVATVAAVGYAAHGVGGGALAAAIAFAPSFTFVLIGGPHFERLRRNPRAQAFLGGAGPAALGAILGSAVPLAGALREWWQIAILALAAAALLVARRGVVSVLVGAGVVGAVAALAGAPLP
jgi:chromate transporter